MLYFMHHSPTHHLQNGMHASAHVHGDTNKCRESSIPSVVGNFAAVVSAMIRTTALYAEL